MEEHWATSHQPVGSQPCHRAQSHTYTLCTMMRPLRGRGYRDVNITCNRNSPTGHGIQPADNLMPFSMIYLQKGLPINDVRGRGSDLHVIYGRGPGMNGTHRHTSGRVPGFHDNMHLTMDTKPNRGIDAIKDLDNTLMSKSRNEDLLAAGIRSILTRDLDSQVHQPNTKTTQPLHQGASNTPVWTFSNPTPTNKRSDPSMPLSSALVGGTPAPDFRVNPSTRETCSTTPKVPARKTRKSHNTTNDNTAWLRCDICDCLVNSEYQMKIHNDGVKHRKKLSQLGKDNGDQIQRMVLSTSPNWSASTSNSSRSSQQMVAMSALPSSFGWVAPSESFNSLPMKNFWQHPNSELPGYDGACEYDSAYSGSDNDDTASQ